jgi:DNA-damage-inducible protein J
MPNEETIAAMQDARKGKLKSFASIDDLMTDLNAND